LGAEVFTLDGPGSVGRSSTKLAALLVDDAAWILASSVTDSYCRMKGLFQCVGAVSLLAGGAAARATAFSTKDILVERDVLQDIVSFALRVGGVRGVVLTGVVGYLG